MELHELMLTVRTREDFIAFVEKLAADTAAREAEIENPTTASYLEAISAWSGSMDLAFRNNGEEPPTEPTWRLFAIILYTARIYE